MTKGHTHNYDHAFRDNSSLNKSSQTPPWECKKKKPTPNNNKNKLLTSPSGMDMKLGTSKTSWQKVSETAPPTMRYMFSPWSIMYTPWRSIFAEDSCRRGALGIFSSLRSITSWKFRNCALQAYMFYAGTRMPPKPKRHAAFEAATVTVTKCT